MICKIEIHGGKAYVFSAPDKPAHLVVPAHLVERRFAKGSRQVGFFDVTASPSGVITDIGERVEQPKDWP